MSADLINLRVERKRRARVSAAKAADKNRVVHGLTKHGKAAAEAERRALVRHLDGHERGSSRPDGAERP